MGVFVIAEAGSSHDCDISKAFRLIEAAKECGADAVKFQWTSNAKKMAERRGLGADAAAMYAKYLQQPVNFLNVLADKAQAVGIEFMCTVYLIEDIATIAPLVKRFKVSAFESGWVEFMRHHYPYGREVITSVKANAYATDYEYPDVSLLYCVSKYPTRLEDLKLRSMWADRRGAFFMRHHGLSDHTVSTLTGALAVVVGATIVEKHIKLSDTDPKNPDSGHSLVADVCTTPEGDEWFATYVRNIREAEKAL